MRHYRMKKNYSLSRSEYREANSSRYIGVTRRRYTRESVSPSAIGRSRAITNWAIDYIKDTLPDYEGESVYGSDLAFEITERPNVNGIYEDNSWDFISKHISDARDEYEYEKDNFGEVTNPFEDPEGFVVRMLINTVSDVLGAVPLVQEYWNDELELTKENINEILKSL